MLKLIENLKNNPAPFYLIHFPLSKQVNELAFWEHIVVSFNSNAANSPFSHPDVLWLAQDKPNYLQEDLESFQKFISLKPSGNDRQKLAIWQDASALSTIIINKLLKDLEDTKNQFVVMMGVRNNSKLPSTLTSRSMIYRIEEKDFPFFVEEIVPEEVKNIVDSIRTQELNPFQLADKLSGKIQLSKQLWDYLLKNLDKSKLSANLIFSLQNSFHRFENSTKVNHLRKDHLIDLGSYLQLL